MNGFYFELFCASVCVCQLLDVCRNRSVIDQWEQCLVLLKLSEAAGHYSST